MKSITDFLIYKQQHRPIAMVTCYDFWSASIIDKTGIDAVLVGDSAAMVMHGYKTTVNADFDMMAMHVAAVSRGLNGKVLLADLPFLAHKKGQRHLMKGVDTLIKAGASGVKIEGADSCLKSVKALVTADIPVMGHLGLTPQSVHKMGGFKLQGKDTVQKQKIQEDAKKLEETGVFALVLEMVPAELAREVTESLTIPTIGIGAGNSTSGQVLVLQDMLGMNPGFNPKFVRHYLEGANLIKGALDKYSEDVKSREFPSVSESY
jgi:3-methyl-2-oxobutanoate hydroxymethyltransferase